MAYVIDAILGNNGIIGMLAVLAMLLAMVIAIVMHELAHGWAALINGDLTAKHAGRLSFNPVVHFDLVGFLMILVVGFGYAKPVPVNPYNFEKPKKGLIMVSLAGVVMNFILAVIFMFVVALMLFLLERVSLASDAAYYVFSFFFYFAQYMVVININLMLFNLLPLGPLDGLKLLEGLCQRGNKVTEFLRTYGQYILWGLIGLSVISSYFSEYAAFFEYIDILGYYLYYGRHFIAGGITSLFTMMFGLGTVGFYWF